jgi:hypothetical protein
MFLNNPLHGCQTDAGALEILGAMQALEDSEQFVDILHVEADAVVPDHEDQLPILFFVTNLDDGA